MPSLQIKTRFLKTDKAKRLADLSASEEFQEMLTTALAYMQLNLPPSQDLASASINQFRMEGAQRFISTLLDLSEVPTTRTGHGGRPTGHPANLNPNPTLLKKGE